MSVRGWGWLPIAVVGASIACGGSQLRSTQFRGPDGTADWWQISCRGDNALCLREAGEVCPRGYDVAGRESHDDVDAKTVASGGSALVSPRDEGGSARHRGFEPLTYGSGGLPNWRKSAEIRGS